MADSYTATLNLTKVEVNASANTWGNKWNSNADLIDNSAASLQAQITALAAALAAANVSAVPIGGIVAYNGPTAPTGWRICDGGAGTPDLRNKFIVGAGANYAPGAQGGADSVVLLGGHLAAHSHGVSDPGHAHGVNDPTHGHSAFTDAQGAHSHTTALKSLGAGGGGSTVFGPVGVDYSAPSSAVGAHAHGVGVNAATSNISVAAAGTGISIGIAGSSAAHENRPPYYALIYIIRLV